jgi:uncharacterized protein (TIGR02231 family)
MKKLFLLVLGVALILNVSWVSAETIAANSKISAVTVYPGSARITRTSQVELTSGTHSIVYEGIVPVFDENSLTVSGKGTARVKILGAYLKQEFLKEAADMRVKELQDQIQEVNDKLVTEQANDQVIADQIEFLNSLKLYTGQQLPKDLITKIPTTIELSDMMKFIGTTREGLGVASDEIRKRKRTLGLELQKLQSELGQLNSGGNKLKRSIVVDVECTQPGNFTVDVSYMLNGANWYAIYDAHSVMEKGEVELVSNGMIKQSTGEDWKEVQLTLSTAQPSLGGRMPYVGPWILTEQAVYPQAARRGLNLMKQATMTTMAMEAVSDSAVQSEAFGGAMPAAAPVMQEALVNYAQADTSGVSVTYQVSRPVTILSDATDNKFPINSQVLKANFEYSAYPKSSPFSYLGSRVINASDLQLLAGPVNLFLGNEFVGKSSIDAISPGQDFDLYLGIDENVKVNRDLLEKKMDDTLIGGIQSPTRKTVFKYKLTVENFTSKAVAFKLFESMPVSENDRIKVKVYDVPIQPTAKDWKDRKGVWLWELTLEPKAKKEIFYTFSVEHPREMNVGGL